MKKYVLDVYEILRKREVETLPAQLAFFFILSIIPTITMLVYLASFISLDLNFLAEFISSNFPNEVAELINPYILGNGFDFKLGFLTFLGFYLASNGVKSLILTSNALYNNSKRRMLETRIKALITTSFLIILILLLLIILVIANFAMKHVIDFFSLYEYSSLIYLIVDIIQWPTVLFIIFIIINTLYTITPYDNIKSNSVIRGSLFATLGISIATIGYTFYVTNFANYSIIYGSLYNIIIFMIYIYMITYIFVIGIALNAKNYKLNKTKENEQNNNDAK